MKKNNLSMWKAVVKIVPMTIKAEPLLFVASIFIAILHGMSFTVIIISMQHFFDDAVLFAEGNADINVLLRSLVFLCFAHVVNQILHGLFGFLYRVQGRKVQEKLTLSINRKMGSLSPESFEDTGILDDILKANEGMKSSVWFSMTFLTTFTFYIPYLIYMSSYLMQQKPMLVLSLLLAITPMIITQLLRSKVFMQLKEASAPLQRELTYYDECMTSREYFKETRQLGAFEFFHSLYRSKLKIVNNLRMKADIRTNLFEIIMQIITIACYTGILIMLLNAALSGEISIGAFGAVFASLGRLFGLMRELVCEHFTYLAQDLGSIVHYVRFLDIQQQEEGDKYFSDSRWITLNNVSFSYPQSQVSALKNISLNIRNKETVAIVGKNGAGKSTLIRIICGIYKPTSGEVLVNGINTKTVSRKALFKSVSAVFQRYQRYQLTLNENIRLSEIDRDTNESELNEITDSVGFSHLDKSFTDGYDTVLSREFGGVDLSGGQWQRIALARGLFRKHSMIILDEPTAAIDPLEEERIYKQFSDISRNKTTLIVTHRIGSAKLADRILVMDKGELVETGSHDELIAHGGKYYDLFKSQQQWYS